MRKTILALVCALSCTVCFAQHWDFNIGLALSLPDRYMFGNSDIYDDSGTTTVNGVSYTKDPKILPTITAEAGYVFPNNRIGAFMGAYWTYAWNDLYGGPSPLYEKEHILHLVPQVRVYYMYSDKMRMYGTLGMGVRYRTFAETFEGDTIRSNYLSFSYVLSPFGMSFFDKWTVSFDVGYGSPWSMVKLSAGYRF